MKRLVVLSLVVAMLAGLVAAFGLPATANALKEAEENKAFIRRFLDAMGKDKSDATLSEYVADTYEEFKQHIAVFEGAFPGYQIIIEDMIAEGDKVVIRGTFRGTHKGDLMGIPPTGKQVTMPVTVIYRIADGKIVEAWIFADQLGLMQQLGVVPPMGEG